ncbi:tRNA1(Val) (adenine(37)-N6)-methyltransferase [Shewanella sp. KT0246]|uniref:tRNA1(Val) (adenine(37)-N6)-methyltransferase n=1 Tax=Shewanella sp. KT0246 TaxID=2815912 RepID=UPI001BC300B1|nr:methyltransferase [Shewanella sp. KT0246]GIU52315.1 tRNA1(Val) (adenine(37)-N6)-methyltransferase [Shewanella sp. KT0246]
MPFTFKQFHIDDSHCGMPVSTDGVILGAWAKLPITTDENKPRNRYRILDIGAGSGLLSLMAVQRINNLNTDVIAVELDDGAAQDCHFNFEQSPWHSQLRGQHQSIQQFSDEIARSGSALFDAIICNPPYFENGPQSDANQRATARHTNTLNFETLLTHIQQLLSANGTASLIIPIQSELGFLAALSQTELVITAKTTICTVETKATSRLLLALKHRSALSKQLPILTSSNLIISDGKGQYTEAMKQLCRDFYLKL